jgi:hypothetical protein
MLKFSRRFSFNKEIFAMVFIAYCACYFLVEFLVFPVQMAVGLPQTNYASLLFLPHGIRVLSIWLYKGRAVIPLFCAHLFIYVLFWLGEVSLTSLAVVFVGTFCAPLAFILVGWIGFDVSVRNTEIVHWRSILAVGFIASIINSLGNSLFLSPYIEPALHLATVATYLVGDTLGVFVLLLILLLGFRLTREYRG